MAKQAKKSRPAPAPQVEAAAPLVDDGAAFDDVPVTVDLAAEKRKQDEKEDAKQAERLGAAKEGEDAFTAGCWAATPSGVMVCDSGIYGPFGKNGDHKQIHHMPLLPTSTISALCADGSRRLYVGVKFKSLDGTIQEAKLTSFELSSYGRPDHPLIKAGWQQPSTRAAGDVAKAMGMLIQERQIPHLHGYEVCGWMDHTTHICPGHPLYVGPVEGRLETRGDRHVWRETQGQLIIDSPLCALATAFLASSLLRGVVSLPHSTSHILHLFGQSSRGKSTILRALAAWAGVPDKPNYIDGASTARGLETRIAASNHGYVLIDEMDQLLANSSALSTSTGHLMFLTNGGGRETSSRGGGQVVGATWSSHIITTGNSSLIALASGAQKSDALATRIFEADILDADLGTFRTPSVLGVRTQALTDNCGWGYPALVEYIAGHRTELSQTYNDFFNDLRATPRLAAMFEDQARLLTFFALCMCGADLVGKIVSPKAGQACHNAIAIAMSRYEQDPSEASSHTAVRSFQVIEAVRDFVVRNSGRFMWRGFAWTSDKGSTAQAAAARQATTYATGTPNGALGEMSQSREMKHDADLEGTLTLSARALDELENREKVSKSELIEAAKLYGVLLTQAGREDVKLSRGLAVSLGGSRGLRLAIRPLTFADADKRLEPAPVGVRHHFLYGLPGDLDSVMEHWDEDTMGPLPEALAGRQLELLDDADEALKVAKDMGPVTDIEKWTRDLADTSPSSPDDLHHD